MACTPAIRSDLQSSETFFSWLNSQSAIANPLMASTHTITPADTIALTNVMTTLKAHSDCLTELTASVETINTGNSIKRTKITELQQQIKDRTLDIQISQDRALLVRHPEMSRSYYEGLLRLGRPMSHYSVPIIIGISTFLLSLSLFMFLNILRIDSRLFISIPAYLYHSSGVGSPYSTPFWIMAGISTVLLGLTIYAFTR